MTEYQRYEAILELAQGLPKYEIHSLAEELDEIALSECRKGNHDIGNDHCGKPEHRFCYICEERETSILARQAKANEAAACKAELPSESLGSSSTLFSRFRGLFN